MIMLTCADVNPKTRWMAGVDSS